MPSPWRRENQLLHIAVRGFDLQAAARPPLNVVLLVDVSGSMGPLDRLPLLKQGFRLLADGLRAAHPALRLTVAGAVGEDPGVLAAMTDYCVGAVS